MMPLFWFKKKQTNKKNRIDMFWEIIPSREHLKKSWWHYIVGLSCLTKLWRARVELLWQKAVISETLHGVSHRDDGHHQQPAPQDVQKATHVFSHLSERRSQVCSVQVNNFKLRDGGSVASFCYRQDSRRLHACYLTDTSQWGCLQLASGL